MPVLFVWRDGATGLYDMRARTYDPETGRFLTPDSAEPNPQFAESFNPYAFANNNPYLYSDPSGLFSITEINVSTGIQSNMRAIQNIAVQQVKSQIIDEVQAAGARLLANTFARLLPVPQHILNNFRDTFLAGRSFESLIANGICGVLGSVVPQYILDSMWFGPRILPTGHPVTDGISCSPDGELIDIPGGAPGQPAPDFVVKSSPPTERRPRAWVVGDFKLSVNTLYDDYISPGTSRNQWLAIANYARKYGYRIGLFIAYKELNSEGRAVFEKLLKEGAGRGVILVIASFDQ